MARVSVPLPIFFAAPDKLEVGGHLDRINRTKVHAFGLEIGGRAVLLLLLISGVKTMMALRVLRTEGVRLLTEDSSLMRRAGPDRRSQTKLRDIE